MPKSGRWVTDHRHAPGWKKLAPPIRRRYVRGIVCAFCNSHVVGRFVTLLKARNVVTYLERFEAALAETEKASVMMESDEKGKAVRQIECKPKPRQVEI